MKQSLSWPAGVSGAWHFTEGLTARPAMSASPTGAPTATQQPKNNTVPKVTCIIKATNQLGNPLLMLRWFFFYKKKNRQQKIKGKRKRPSKGKSVSLCWKDTSCAKNATDMGQEKKTDGRNNRKELKAASPATTQQTDGEVGYLQPALRLFRHLNKFWRKQTVNRKC